MSMARDDEQEAIRELACAMQHVANAILPNNAMSGEDETGGTIRSLTEAVLGVTAGLVWISRAIDGLAEAVRERGES